MGRKKKTQEQFEKEISEKNPNIEIIGKYIGDVDYVLSKCKTCGYTWNTKPNDLLHGHGCPKCGRNKSKAYSIKNRKSDNDFKKEVYKINPDIIILGDYITRADRILVKCKVCGYEWNPIASNLLHGRGCPSCSESYLERNIRKVISKKLVRQQKFDWLVSKDLLRLDFYIPELNLAIECQGIQHFISVDHFGGEDGFKRTCERDLLKYNLCKDHGIKILYYCNKEDYNLIPFGNGIYTSENVFSDLEELEKFINNYEKDN